MSKNWFVAPGSGYQKAALNSQAQMTDWQKNQLERELAQRSDMRSTYESMLNNPNWTLYGNDLAAIGSGLVSKNALSANSKGSAGLPSLPTRGGSAPKLTFTPTAMPTLQYKDPNSFLPEAPSSLAGTLPSVDQVDFSKTLAQVPGYSRQDSSSYAGELFDVTPYNRSERPQAYVPDAQIYDRLNRTPDAGAMGLAVQRAYQGAGDTAIGQQAGQTRGSRLAGAAARGVLSPTAVAAIEAQTNAWQEQERAKNAGAALEKRLAAESALRGEDITNALAEAALRRQGALDTEAFYQRGLDEEAARRAEQRGDVGLRRGWYTEDLQRNDAAEMDRFGAELTRATTAEGMTMGRVDAAAKLAETKQRMGADAFNQAITRAITAGNLTQQQLDSIRQLAQYDRDTALALWEADVAGADLDRTWQNQDYEMASNRYLTGEQLDAALRGENRGNLWDIINYLTGRQDTQRREYGAASDTLPLLGAGVSIAGQYGDQANQYGQMAAQNAAQWGSLASLLVPIAMSNPQWFKRSSTPASIVDKTGYV